MAERRRLSIRLRTALVATGIVAAAGAGGGIALIEILRHQLSAGIDRALATRLEEIRANTAAGVALPTSLPNTGDEGTVVQIFGANGTVGTQSANINDRAPLAPMPIDATSTTFRTIEQAPIGDIAAYRVAVKQLSALGDAVLVGASLDATRESLHTLRSSLFVGIPALLGCVGAVTWFAAGRVLAPVESIRSAVADISASDLARRVPEPAGRDEISRLASTMNQMLHRLDAAGIRQRAFVADASHELRTPLTSMQTQLDVALANPAHADWDRLGRQLHADTTRLQQMADDLLFLAVAEEGPPPRADIVDLDELIVRVVEPLRFRGRVRVDLSGVAGGRVLGDPNQLTRLLSNLVDNAERHANALITIELRATDCGVELVVADDGPGIPADERERIFERFTRLDPARQRQLGGAGLGLSIVRTIADTHAATIVVADQPRGTRIVVTFPAPVTGDGS